MTGLPMVKSQPAPEGPARTRGWGPPATEASSPDADAADFFADADAWWVGAMMKGAWITIVPASLPVLSESVAPVFMLLSRGRGGLDDVFYGNGSEL